MALTYNQLVVNIQNYLKRGPSDDDLTAILPWIIENAQRRLSLELKSIYNRSVATATLTQGDPVVAKPSDWRQTLYINMGTGTDYNTRVQLYPRAYDYLATQFWPDRSQTATPLYYADYDVNHYLIAATPDAPYPIEITYYSNPEFISLLNQTNYYTMNTPDLLLKACLVETPGYLKRPEFVDVWLNDYNRLLLAYNSENRGRQGDQVENRTEGKR